VLLAARGRSNARIAAETRLHVDPVRTWRGRFATGGLPALTDCKCPGRPARFTPLQVAEAKAPACQLSAETGVPLSRWSSPELAAELTARGITDTVSASTVRRRLHEGAVKPWQYQSWIFIRDPDFRAKAQRVLDLYARTFEGTPLSEDEYVLSSDEKTSIQARCRCHPTLTPGQARAMRVNHEYGRGGALAYLAPYDVHRATTASDQLARPVSCARWSVPSPTEAYVANTVTRSKPRVHSTSSSTSVVHASPGASSARSEQIP
jgi:transposase